MRRNVLVAGAEKEVDVVRASILRFSLEEPEVRASVWLDGDDYLVCKCRAHAAVEHDVEGARGCSAMSLGTATFVSTESKEPGGHGACVAEPATRRQDQLFVQAVVTRAFTRGLKGKIGHKEKRRWCNGYYRDRKNFGAGYCYFCALEPGAMSRSSRVVGPLPYLVVAAAFVSVVGTRGRNAIDLVEVEPGVYHAVETVRTVGDAALDFLRRVADIVDKEGPFVRVGLGGELAAEVSGRTSLSVLPRDMVPTLRVQPIGCDARVTLVNLRVAKLVAELRSWGVEYPGDAGVDLATATSLFCRIPADAVGVKERFRMYEQVGDAVLKEACVRRVLENGGTVADVQTVGLRHSNAALTKLTTREPWVSLFDLEGSLVDSTTRADVVEAFVGVIHVFAGAGAALRVVESMGLLPKYVQPKVHAHYAMKTEAEVTVEGLAAMLGAAKIRGEDAGTVLERVQKLLSDGGAKPKAACSHE